MHVWISGFAMKPDAFDVVIRKLHGTYPNVDVQFVDLDKVPGSRYLLLATLNALKSFHSNQPISRTLSMEILLYASANRQITEAIRLVGISSDTNRIAAIVVGKIEGETISAADLLSEILNQKSNDTLIDDWSPARIQNVISIFRIGSSELKATLRENESRTQAVERLAIERSALLTVRK